MSDYYELTKGIRITVNEPVDGDRYIASTIANRDKIITLARAFNGLQVYVESEEKLYILIDMLIPTWKEIAIGGADKHKEYEKTIANAVWTIDHTLDKHPSIDVVGVDGKAVECEVHYTSKAQVILRFNAPFAGKAFLN